ncbi:TrmB family transcriptional regulator [Halosimplex pelagicum]|uniref:TrmB family transcriptional regulator n=1 Tax=Halosimplex pelagicum TaxID=869886 RepID=A0A7D5PEJ3_9EURY|nr:TrmB family transcriptional regulator sugar-binding domain-containing protein [Halosimplex pelagicum]QLH81619.1 TrmB family transcriptional regulator [Halosimplex pelagicum]
MERDEILGGLEDAGLTSYQADAYLTLLDMGVSPAVDVARNCSVPVPRIYDVLTELEQMGYAETLDRETLHARAREPAAFVQDLHEKSDRLSAVAEEIEDRWEASPLGDNKMNVTKRVDTVVDHAEGLIREADWTVDLALTDEQLVAYESALTEAFESDVVVRASVVPAGEVGIADHPVSDAVTEIRERPIPGPFCALVDRTKACLAPTTRMPEPYGVVIDDDIIPFIFRWYFQTCLWANWETVSRCRERSAVYVCLEEFIRDAYPLWWDDAVVSVTVSGMEPDSGRDRTVSGVLTDIRYSAASARTGRRPTLTDLSGQATIVLWTPEGRCTVGGWGALHEDLEVKRVTVDGVEWLT